MFDEYSISERIKKSNGIMGYLNTLGKVNEVKLR